MNETEKVIKFKLRTCYNNMMQRCYNTNSPAYKIYGARGITVCPIWANSYQAFFEDMRPGFSIGLQLDRIDTYGDYSRENCQWLTQSENCTKPRRPYLFSRKRSANGQPRDVFIGIFLTRREKELLDDELKRKGLGRASFLRLLLATHIMEPFNSKN